MPESVGANTHSGNDAGTSGSNMGSLPDLFLSLDPSDSDMSPLPDLVGLDSPDSDMDSLPDLVSIDQPFRVGNPGTKRYRSTTAPEP